MSNLNDFIESKEAEFDQRWDKPVLHLGDGEEITIELRDFIRSALRECAEKTIAAVSYTFTNEGEERMAQHWLGTKDQPHE